MQPRAFRLKLHDVIGSLGHEAVEVVNISRTGALLRAPSPAPIASEQELTLRLHHQNVELPVRVVRETAAPDAYLQWLIAVEFTSPAEALEQIKVLMSQGGA
ncbi:MAG: PilZ domain-containing protein [Vicinamibacterales bacterium]